MQSIIIFFCFCLRPPPNSISPLSSLFHIPSATSLANVSLISLTPNLPSFSVTLLMKVHSNRSSSAHSIPKPPSFTSDLTYSLSLPCPRNPPISPFIILWSSFKFLGPSLQTGSPHSHPSTPPLFLGTLHGLGLFLQIKRGMPERPVFPLSRNSPLLYRKPSLVFSSIVSCIVLYSLLCIFLSPQCYRPHGCVLGHRHLIDLPSSPSRFFLKSSSILLIPPNVYSLNIPSLFFFFPFLTGPMPSPFFPLCQTPPLFFVFCSFFPLVPHFRSFLKHALDSILSVWLPPHDVTFSLFDSFPPPQTNLSPLLSLDVPSRPRRFDFFGPSLCSAVF